MARCKHGCKADTKKQATKAKKNKPATKELPEVNHAAIRKALDQTIAASVLAGIEFRADSRWKPCHLVYMAVLWAVSGEANLTDRFRCVCGLLGSLFGDAAPQAISYQAFTKLLKRWSGTLLIAVMLGMRERMRLDLPQQYLLAGRCVFAVDGSRVEVPRTTSNEARFASGKARKSAATKKKSKKGRQRAKTQSARSRAKKANSPQLWLTTMWHVGTGMPWGWRSGPSGSSERDHCAEMLAELPPGSLLTGDAGFAGYPLWSRVLAGNPVRHDLLIRVGSNVRLLKELGVARERAGLVYLWPENAARKQQPPLVLRLVQMHTGRQPVYLVTSVLDPKELTDKQIIEIYKKRWGVEVFYRHFKQTFGRRKLRSRQADNVPFELDWSLVGLWAVCLLAAQQIVADEGDPSRLSVAQVLRAVREVIRGYSHTPPPERTLWRLLKVALKDNYVRKKPKASRDYPRKKRHDQFAGPPEIVVATKTQVANAKRIVALTTAK
jgi:hypothetical protein